MTRRALGEAFARFGLLVAALLVAFTVAEIAARLWLVHLATPEQFAAYASHRQIAARPAVGRISCR